MQARARFLRGPVAVTVFGTALVGALWPQAAAAGTVERPIAAKMVVMTQAGTNGGCHGSIFAVVKDHPDAVEYRVTVVRTDGDPAGSTVTFNRHERGNLQFTPFVKWNPGGGQIAGLLTSGSADGPGDDCADIRADYESRFSIKGARVVMYTPNRPPAKAAAYEVRSVASPPPNDGVGGKDGCATYQFVTVPAVKGAVRYRIKLVESIVGVQRTTNLVLTPAEMNPKPPAGAKIGPYKSAGRLGHFFAYQQRDRWGCRWAEWQVATAVKHVSVRVEKR